MVGVFMHNSLLNRVCLIKILFLSCLILLSTNTYTMDVPIYDFPIDAYSQKISDYFSQDNEDYSKNLLTPAYQASQQKNFYNHYYSSDEQGLSPWNESMIEAILPFIKKIEPETLDNFNNQNKSFSEKHFAENFKEHDIRWFRSIKEKMDLSTLNAITYKSDNRAIAVANTPARTLPTEAPDFYHTSLPGQGFPFDNLQDSAVWAGTPLYVFTTSKDKAWSLVLTPDNYFSWVKSSDIAYVSDEFINQWQIAAQKNMVAITETETPILDKHQHFQFAGFIGAVFPLAHQDNQNTAILIPVKNETNQAIIKVGLVHTNAASLMPLVASPKNLARIIAQLKNRPYGWGGAFFFNDCSQEIKSIFTPFGFWLPRNSGAQATLNSTLDLSSNNLDERLNALKSKGHPLMTIIYIGGHVMLYVGNKDNNDHEVEAITYQNVWGLSPQNRDKRYVIGQSLFLPLLKYYPENPDVSSLAGKASFKLVFLDTLETSATTPQRFAKSFAAIQRVREF